MDNAVIKDLAYYISHLKNIQDNHLHGSLAGLDVSVFDSISQKYIDCVKGLEAKSWNFISMGNQLVDNPERGIRSIMTDPLHSNIPVSDVIFFDNRSYAGFDHVNGVTSLVAQAKHFLKPNGLLFAILRNGVVNHFFDVYNPVVRGHKSFLPSQDFLLRSLLCDCSVRILDQLPADYPGEYLKFYRLSMKKPTLILFFGKSQSGKTSVARDLQTLDPDMHVSNDYIYVEIVKLVKTGAGGSVPSIIAEAVGDGGGKDCFYFNRALEKNGAILDAYLEWIVNVLPRNKRLISMDIDINQGDVKDRIKDFLGLKGFSVWVANR